MAGFDDVRHLTSELRRQNIRRQRGAWTAGDEVAYQRVRRRALGALARRQEQRPGQDVFAPYADLFDPREIEEERRRTPEVARMLREAEAELERAGRPYMDIDAAGMTRQERVLRGLARMAEEEERRAGPAGVKQIAVDPATGRPTLVLRGGHGLGGPRPAEVLYGNRLLGLAQNPQEFAALMRDVRREDRARRVAEPAGRAAPPRRVEPLERMATVEQAIREGPAAKRRRHAPTVAELLDLPPSPTVATEDPIRLGDLPSYQSLMETLERVSADIEARMPKPIRVTDPLAAEPPQQPIQELAQRLAQERALGAQPAAPVDPDLEPSWVVRRREPPRPPEERRTAPEPPRPTAPVAEPPVRQEPQPVREEVPAGPIDERTQRIERWRVRAGRLESAIAREREAEEEARLAELGRPRTFEHLMAMQRMAAAEEERRARRQQAEAALDLRRMELALREEARKEMTQARTEQDRAAAQQRAAERWQDTMTRMLAGVSDEDFERELPILQQRAAEMGLDPEVFAAEAAWRRMAIMRKSQERDRFLEMAEMLLQGVPLSEAERRIMGEGDED